MAKFIPWDRFEMQCEFRKKWTGKTSFAGASAVLDLDTFRKKLADAESWLAVNPQNQLRQAEVTRLRKAVKELEEKVEAYI